MPKSNLKKIPLIDGKTSRNGFLKRINTKIKSINQLIQSYNKATDKVREMEILETINELRISILDDYSPYDISQTAKFSQVIHSQLFNILKQACEQQGITVHDLNQIKKKSLEVEQNQTDISLLIDNMSPDKISQFLSLLEQPTTSFFGYKKNINHTLAALYLPHEKIEPDAMAFDKFLRNNSIDYLAGINSKNFKITPLNGEKPFVLKIENRMGTPKKIENDLAIKLSHLGTVFVPKTADRQTSSTQDGKVITKNIMINAFFKQGDLQFHAQKLQSDAMKARSAINIYTQMTLILNGIQEAHCMFPDMKNTNWLLGDDDVLYINDTKSFRYTDVDHAYDRGHSTHTNRWSQLFLSSQYMNPPEYNQKVKPIQSDPLHAYMLGKNIYQFLSNCSPSYLREHTDGRAYDFSSPLFKTTYGNLLRKLIIKLVKKYPRDRMEMNEVLEQFEIIKSVLLKDQLESIKKTIRLILETRQDKDPILANYAKRIELEINPAMSTDEAILLNEKMTSIERVSSLFDKLITRLKQKGQYHKAQTLEQHFSHMSAEDRLSIFSSNSSVSLAFREALASHHYFFRQPVTYKDPEKKVIDEQWASYNFIAFKKAVHTP